MKVIVGKTKTTQLIINSSLTGNYIVCHSLEECNRVANEAKRLGFKRVPYPISYDEFLSKQYHGKGIKGFLIDNIELFLQGLTDVPINSISTRCRIMEANESDFKTIYQND